MDKQQAQKIIKDTFEHSFDMDRFTVFIKNLLNRIDESKAFHAHGYVKEGFRGIIKTYERIGTYNTTDDKKVDIIVVFLQKGSSLDHARVTQRNFAGRYLDDRGEKDAGLFAFVSPDEEDWRFSLVKMDYKFDKNGKVKEEFTPARRWSFLVGKNEKSHTAQSRLVNILADDEHDPTLERIENAFDIETVTKEFFVKYRELFLRTKDELDNVVNKDPKVEADFEAKGVDSVNFAKKLLGQIIFLYFLQKKGWFGVGRDDDWGTGSKHFLRELFEKKHLSAGALAQAGGDYLPAPQSNAPRQAGNNFFNNILEPLFYEALRIDRSHDDGYYSRFNCKIPFLNGGLFDPIGNYDWVHTDIIIPDRLFSNNVKTKEGDTGTGILDVFDRYNFTVKEDEPLEKEVAIDPELLGKSYEKFNAIRAENYDEFRKALKSGKTGEENKFNKKFGVYYTPREIVHYMCQQSLINYLDTAVNIQKESIINKPIVQKKLFGPQDPVQLTISSDSYKPIIPKKDIEKLIHTGEQVSENEARVLSKGKETKTYSHQLPENIRKNAGLIDRKLADITVCDLAVGSGAFPVGMMSEIVRARNVLSTFIDDSERTPYVFKRQCIEHSLYGVDIDPGAVEIAKLRLWLSLVVDEENIKNIKPLPNLDYRIMQGNSLISEFLGINFDTEEERSSENLMFKDETDELIGKFQQKKDEFLNESNVTRKSKLKEEIEDLLVKIFETKLKTQKANYFKRLKDIENKYSILPNEKQRDELIKGDKEKLYKESGFDLESAEKQLKEFTSGKKIKPFFLWNLYFSEVFHNNGGFDVVIANPPYFLYQGHHKEEIESIKKSPLYELCKGGKLNAYKLFLAKSSFLSKKRGLIVLIFQNSFLADNAAINIRKHYLENHRILRIDSFPERDDYNKRVFESVKMSVCILLSIKEKINDYKFVLRVWESRKMLANWSTMFSKSSIKSYGEKTWQIPYLRESEKNLFDKLFSGERNHVRCYEGEINMTFHKYLLSQNSKHPLVLKGAAVQRYFVTNKMSQGILEYLNEPLYLKTNSGNKANHHNFDRVVMQGITGVDDKRRIIMAIVKNGNYLANSCNYIMPNEQYDIKFLLGFFNSNITNWIFKRTSTNSNVNCYEIEAIPLPSIVKLKQELIISIVEKILSLTIDEKYPDNSQKQAKVKALEQEIDQLVYKLYDLTPDEIAIVEEA